MTGEQLELAGRDALALVEDLDVVEGVVTAEEFAAPVLPAGDGDARDGEMEARNLSGEADRIAARASMPGTRRQYAAIYRAFAHWLRGELGRPPVVGDLYADVIAAYARHLTTSGGGGMSGRPRDRTRDVSMVRALARQLGREDAIAHVRAPPARARAARDAH